MNKSLYTLLNLFLGLSVAAGIASSIFNFQIGANLFNTESYAMWFLVVNITGITSTLLLLKYYHYRNYRFAFFTGIIALIADISNGAVIYILLTSGELRSYYAPTLALRLCAIILYALSLLFSNVREKLWLKLAGTYTLIIGVILLATLAGGIYAKDFHIISVLREISQWTSMAACIVPVFYIMNFLSELRILKTENTNESMQKSSDVPWGLVAIIPFVFMIILGTSLANEGSQQLFWQKHNAEQAQGLVTLAGGTKTFVNSKGDSLHYLLIKPYDYDPQKKYPMVVCLPYGGYEASAAEILTTGINRTTYPAFIFVPYCPKGTGWGGAPGFSPRDAVVYETIDALAEPAIDVKRRYVTGVSLGGYGAWQFICKRPDMFAAAIPVSGAGDPKLAPKAIHVAVWAFHGAKDKNVLVSGSRDMIAAIKKAGGHPEYTEYLDEAHNIWDKVSDTPGLWNWLFSQKQN